MPLIDPQARISVSDERGNTFWLKAKMDLATDAAVTAEYGRLSAGLRLVPQRIYDLAMLRNNLLAWAGPDYVDGDGKPIPCTAGNIGRLDPDDPLVQAALAAIDKANAKSTVSANGQAGDVGAQTSQTPAGEEDSPAQEKKA